jgi:hypothetical protein
VGTLRNLQLKLTDSDRIVRYYSECFVIELHVTLGGVIVGNVQFVIDSLFSSLQLDRILKRV